MVACVTGCASAPKQDPVAFTRQALAATTSDQAGSFEKGSAAESAAIERFEKFNNDFSAANITNNTRMEYAPGFIFATRSRSSTASPSSRIIC
jgi:hypothetical protein